MISQTMQDALNAHIQAENYSSYLYLAMSAWCDQTTFKGFGRWLRVQASEEREHALKMMDYLIDRGGKVTLGTIEAPASQFGTMQQVFEAVLKHEQHVTSLVHKLFETARAEKDLATEAFLQWYVAEQVQEEAAATEVVEKIRMVGDRPGSVLYLDKEYGKRQS